MRKHHRNIILGLALITLQILSIPSYIGILQPIKAQTINPASTTCFAVDGKFTHCTSGPDEWSDVTAGTFPGSDLYAVDRNADPTKPASNPSGPDTLFLMYDDYARIIPLGADEFVTVAFKTTEVENGAQVLEHYTVHIYGDNSFELFINNVLQPPGRVNAIEDELATAGFGPSPSHAIPHVMAEFSIGLSAAGFNSYANNPLFWSSGNTALPELKCYNISPAHTPGNMVQLVDQFNAENLTVGASKELCITAIKNNEPNGFFQLNEKCYTIQGIDPPDVVDLVDQFHNGASTEKNVPVGPANLLCASVKKTAETPAPVTLTGNPPQVDVDLKCYQISGQAVTASVFLQTQFGNESNVALGPADRLCTAVTKSDLTTGIGSVPPSPFDQLDFKCYPITNGQDDPHVVSLQDQFGVETNVQVGTPSHLCTNAFKTKVTPPTTPTQPDLKCYHIDDKSPGAIVDLQPLETPLGAETNVKVGNATALCVWVSKNGGPVPFKQDFKCYDITGDQPPTNNLVNLVDQFGTESNVPLGPAIKLCSAVTKNPLASNQPPPPIDLKCYSITDQAVNQVVNLQDQFGTETGVGVLDPFMVCVSVLKTTSGTAPPNPTPLQLDFKCYNITPPHDPGKVVNLQDQFGFEPNVRVGPSFALCSAVKKTIVGSTTNPIPPPPTTPELGLKCYQISGAAPTVPPVNVIMDQFGNETGVVIGKPIALCNAAWKVDASRPLTQKAPFFDLKCYSIAGHDPKQRVDLRDEFGNETNIDVGAAFAFCVTVIKNGIQPQLAPIDLKCYSILGDDPNAKVNLSDEFENETNVDVGQATSLCTIAVKNPASTHGLTPLDFKCYTIAGTPPNVPPVTLQGIQFPEETNVVVGAPVLVCDQAIKTLHLQPTDSDGDGIPDTTDNCILVPNPTQTDKNVTAGGTPDGVGDGCETPLSIHATSAVLQVSASTHVTEEGTMVNQEPTLQEQVMMIVDDECGTNVTCRQIVAHDLLQSQVDLGLITQGEANVLEQAIVGPTGTPVFPYVLPLAVAIAIALGSLVFLKRKRLSALTSSFFASIFASFSTYKRRKRS